MGGDAGDHGTLNGILILAGLMLSIALTAFIWTLSLRSQKLRRSRFEIERRKGSVIRAIKEGLDEPTVWLSPTPLAADVEPGRPAWSKWGIGLAWLPFVAALIFAGAQSFSRPHPAPVITATPKPAPVAAAPLAVLTAPAASPRGTTPASTAAMPAPHPATQTTTTTTIVVTRPTNMSPSSASTAAATGTPVSPSPTSGLPLTGSVTFNLPPYSFYAYRLNLAQDDVVNVMVKVSGAKIGLLVKAPGGKPLVDIGVGDEWRGIIGPPDAGAFKFEFSGGSAGANVTWQYTSTLRPQQEAHEALVESFDVKGLGYLAFDGSDLWEIKNSSISKLSKEDLSRKTVISLSTTLPDFAFDSGGFPYAYAFTPGHLWVGARGKTTVLRLNTGDGSSQQFSVGGWPRSIAYDGEMVWIQAEDVAEQYLGILTVLREGSGAAVQQWRTSSTNHPPSSSILYAEDGLWTSFAMNELKKVALAGQVLARLPNYDTYSMAYDGAFLWVSAQRKPEAGKPGSGPQILRIRSSDGTIVEAASQPTGSDYLRGLYFDGQHLWAVSNYEARGMVSKLQLSAGSLAILDTVTLPRGFSYFAQPPVFDGENVWVRLSGSNTVAKVRLKP